MFLHHQSTLPFSYYSKDSKRVIVKIITDYDCVSVKVVYGDPFFNRKTGKNDKAGNEIWKWVYEETTLLKQYSGYDEVMWRGEIEPPATRRLKYAFILTDDKGRSFFYNENGIADFSPKLITAPHNHFFYPFVHEIDAPDVPEWVGDTIWYQIFPERFYNGKPSISPPDTEDWEKGSPKSNSFFGGDLYGVIEKLPYIKSLGFTGIYMTPVFSSPTNHKYDTKDYLEVDEFFGDKETLKELVTQAHKLDIKVMLDAVFNHIGSKHAFWQDVLKNQEKSKYKDYFHIRSFPVQESYKDRESLNYDTFAFVANMPKWNTENPEARKYLIDAALFWIKECDIDGWRLDVSDEVSFSFWQDFKKAVRGLKEDVYILGELWHDPSKWLNGGYFDAVMNYPLSWDICDFFLSNKMSPDLFTHSFMSKLMRFSDMHNNAQFNLMDSHDTMRMLTRAGGNKLAMKNAFLFMMLMKGTPCIYYGTEVGMEGDHDPDCRRPMIWDEDRHDLEIKAFFKNLIALRSKYNELIQNAVLSYKRKKKLCFWTLTHGNEQLTIVYNNGKSEKKIDGQVLLASCENVVDILPEKSIAICSHIGSEISCGKADNTITRQTAKSAGF